MRAFHRNELHDETGRLSSALAGKGQLLPELFHGDTRLKDQLLGRLAALSR